MPPVAAVVVAAAAGAAAVSGVIAVTTALMVASVALAASALLNKPEMPGVGTSPSDRKQVIRAAASPMAGVIGTSQLSGVLTFAEERKDNDELHLAVTLSGHTKAAGEKVIEKVNTIFMDDQEIPLGSSHSGNVFVRVYDGSQTKISDLGTELTQLPSWRSDMIGNGVCFAHIRVRYDQELFPSGVPNFVFELDTKGQESSGQQKVSLSSDAILEYLQHHFGATNDEIDFDSFDIARQICAETVSNGDGGSESRYSCNGAFNFDESHKQVLDKMRHTCAGQMSYINGQFGLRVGAYNGPSDFVLTEDDIIGDVTVKPQPDRRSLINTCKGKHVWPAAKFQEVDFPRIQSEPLLAEDGEELEKDLNLEFCHSPYQCQRLAANDISRARLPVITAPCNMRAFECYLGRNIQLHMPSMGYDHKECVVEGWELNPEKGVTLTLREDSPEVWTDIVGKVPVLPANVNLPNPKECRAVQNIQLIEQTVDGVWEAKLNWSHPHPASVYKYKVLFEKQVNGNWLDVFNGSVTPPTFTVTNPNTGNYRLSVTAVNRFDVSSTTVTHALSVNVPEVILTSLVADVDNSVYPASALVVAEVMGAASFAADSVIYESETKTASSDWLPVGKGTTASCRLSGLDAGLHQVRMRATPPYGETSPWVQTAFEVFAADQPTDMVFSLDSSHDRWGFITWAGAGQSWEIVISNNQNTVVWSNTTTERQLWFDWLKPGAYSIAVRARAGSVISDWSRLSQVIRAIPKPANVTFDTSAAGGNSTGTLRWETIDPRPQTYDVEVIADGKKVYASPSYETSEPLPVLLPGNYIMRVRARWNTQLSNWVSVNFGYNIAPADITGMRLSGLGKQALLSWDKPGEDVYGSGFVQVRHTHKTGTSANWEAAAPLTDRLPGNTTQIAVPLRDGTYLVKAVNSTGLWSEVAAAVVSNMADSIGFNRVVERVEPVTWPGQKNKASVSSISLTLKESAANNNPPSYRMNDTLDLGAVFTARITLECDGSVYEQDLIDDRTDNIDSWPRFDGATPGNTSLQYFISQTDDDPASSTAQWSDWEQFLLGEFRARAFRLQVRLVTDSNTAVGTIAGLKLVADVPDRTESQNNDAIPASGKTIGYSKGFMATARIFVTGHGLTAGDHYQITQSTKTGFNIQWFSSAGAGVARSCDWQAISYGEQD